MIEYNVHDYIRQIIKPKVDINNSAKDSNKKTVILDLYGKPFKKCDKKKNNIIEHSEQDKWIITDKNSVSGQLSDCSRRDFIRNSVLLTCSSLFPFSVNGTLFTENVAVLNSNILQKNMLGFHGERMDQATGLYPLGQGYRWYNPVLRRFCQYDRNASPFGIGGINGYAFAMNNPIGITDPSGHGIIASIIAFIASVSSAISAAVGAVSSSVSSIASIVGTHATITTLIGGASGTTAASVGSFTTIATKSIIYTGLASGLTEAVRASVGAIALASGASEETAQLAEDITYNIFASAFFFIAAINPISSTATNAVKAAGYLGRTGASLGLASQIGSVTSNIMGSSNTLTANKITQAALWFAVVADALALASSPLSNLKVAKSSGKYNIDSMKSSYTYKVRLKTNNGNKQGLSNTVERFTDIGVNALESTATNLAVAGYYGQDSTLDKVSKTMTVFNHGTMATLNRKKLARKDTTLNFLKEGFRTVRIGYKGSWALNAHLPLHEEAFYGRTE
ncbi:RHS repeat-associated core domain-containing protein [Vibrio coralliilyticus]|uniref:RHS repeat-associated core domain-containing protein n=1 Tax=Vibrio coralliilyticus TaxID=190893 RepID=UPI001E2C60DA|nr:RHS repeat-associated core domain-containing protein [Vibrio coralliilyticus]MCC2525568.1 RHS repeat-associated core domain-containing protein [Vibrio coralliilyticus]